MEHVKTHKIHPVKVLPGDTINLIYSWEDPHDVWNTRLLTMDSFTEATMIDTVIVYRTTEGEYGLKGGRALIIGQDDGTYKDLPITKGQKPLTGERIQNA